MLTNVCLLKAYCVVLFNVSYIFSLIQSLKLYGEGNVMTLLYYENKAQKVLAKCLGTHRWQVVKLKHEPRHSHSTVNALNL